MTLESEVTDIILSCNLSWLVVALTCLYLFESSLSELSLEIISILISSLVFFQFIKISELLVDVD